jgi:hypothetical protein
MQVRDLINFIKNNIKDIRTIRIAARRRTPQVRCLAIQVAILKNIRKSFDLKSGAIAMMNWW